MNVADRLNELHAEITANETWGGDPDICSMSLDSLVVALPKIAAVIAAAEKELPTCGEWIDHPERGPHRCAVPADLILWGKLFDPEALGPRCMYHAAQHNHALDASDLSQWAVVDLRPRRRALAALAARLNGTT